MHLCVSRDLVLFRQMHSLEVPSRILSTASANRFTASGIVSALAFSALRLIVHKDLMAMNQ